MKILKIFYIFRIKFPPLEIFLSLTPKTNKKMKETSSGLQWFYSFFFFYLFTILIQISLHTFTKKLCTKYSACTSWMMFSAILKKKLSNNEIVFYEIDFQFMKNLRFCLPKMPKWLHNVEMHLQNMLRFL